MNDARLLRIFNTRTTKNAMTNLDKDLSAKPKQWLELNQGEKLVDGEHRIHAFLTPNNDTDWDLRPLPDEAILAMARAGLLTVRTRMFDTTLKGAPTTTLVGINNHRGVRNLLEGWAMQVKAMDE